MNWIKTSGGTMVPISRIVTITHTTRDFKGVTHYHHVAVLEGSRSQPDVHLHEGYLTIDESVSFVNLLFKALAEGRSVDTGILAHNLKNGYQETVKWLY